MSDQPNNPAARLEILLANAKTIPGNKPIRQAWARLLGIPPEDVRGVLSGIATAILMTEEAIKAIEGIEGHNHKLYLQPLQSIMEGFATIRLDLDWTEVTKHFDEKTMYGLSVCSDILSKYSTEKLISESDVASFLSQAEALQKTVAESDLPPSLKLFVTEQLEKIRIALLQYKLFGNTRLQTALESVAGAALFRGEEVTHFWHHPVIIQIVNYLTTIANVVTVTQGFLLLTDGVQKLIDLGKQ